MAPDDVVPARWVITAIAAFFVLAVALFAAAVYWGQQEPDTLQTTPEVPPENYKLYLASIVHSNPVRTSAKKGIQLGQEDCAIMDLLGASWNYGYSTICEGSEHVPYLDSWKSMQKATESVPDLSTATYVMFLNECDNSVFSCPGLEDQAQALVTLETLYPHIIWVGPCSAGIDSNYAGKFWKVYESITGHSPDPATHRMCIHCYGNAEPCINTVWAQQQVGLQHGLDKIWVAEFGALAGATLNFTQVNEQNSIFTNWLENSPGVERYAYWAANYEPGHYAPGNFLTGWHPLTYKYRDKDNSIQIRLTIVGEWFRTVGQEE